MFAGVCADQEQNMYVDARLILERKLPAQVLEFEAEAKLVPEQHNMAAKLPSGNDIKKARSC